MAASFLEIVELPGGEIVLRRDDDDDKEPLLTLTFSEEARFFLQGNHFEVAKAMFDAGINLVSSHQGGDSSVYIDSDYDKKVLH